MNKILIKISDLKLYKWASSFDSDICSLLFDKMHNLGMTGVFKDDKYFWVQQEEVFINLGFFSAYTRIVIKDFIVVKNDNFYTEIQKSFETGEALLLFCFAKLIRFWRSILPLIAELYKYYPEFKGEFGALEYKFLDIWISMLPVMDEILILLTKLKSNFVFTSSSEEHFRLFYLTPIKTPIGVPIGERSDISQHLLDKLDKKTALLVLNDSLVYYAENKKLLNLWIETKIEYKFRIKELNLSEEEAILFVLKDVAPDLSLETLKFLIANLVIDLEDFRNRAKKLWERSQNKKEDF